MLAPQLAADRVRSPGKVTNPKRRIRAEAMSQGTERRRRQGAGFDGAAARALQRLASGSNQLGGRPMPVGADQNPGRSRGIAVPLPDNRGQRTCAAASHGGIELIGRVALQPFVGKSRGAMRAAVDLAPAANLDRRQMPHIRAMNALAAGGVERCQPGQMHAAPDRAVFARTTVAFDFSGQRRFILETCRSCGTRDPGRRLFPRHPSRLHALIGATAHFAVRAT